MGIIRKSKTKTNGHLEHVAKVLKEAAWKGDWVNRKKIHVLVLIHFITCKYFLIVFNTMVYKVLHNTVLLGIHVSSAKPTTNSIIVLSFSPNPACHHLRHKTINFFNACCNKMTNNAVLQRK